MSDRSIRIMCQINWRDEAATISRLWDGSGPYVDPDGEVWIGAAALAGIDGVDLAINGEASTLIVELSGVSSDNADLVWESYDRDEIVGSDFRILIQGCDAADQPIGEPERRFTGTIDNVISNDKPSAETAVSSLTVEVGNRFTMRRRSHGAVLSDTDQRARAAVLNPSAPPDRFGERVPLMQDKTVVFPRWN